MPDLDRRVIVRVAVDSTNAFGEPVSTTVDYPAWAELLQDTVARNVEAGGTYGLAGRTWRVRFDQRFLTAHEAGSTVEVISGGEDPDIVTGVGEPATMRGEHRRRRFLDLTT